MSEEPRFYKKFVEGLREGKLLGMKCKSCGNTITPPSAVCPGCHSMDLEWIELSKEGTLATYTIIHVAPDAFKDKAPYAVGVVRLDGGGSIFGYFRGDISNIEIGKKVKIVFSKEDGDLYYHLELT